MQELARNQILTESNEQVPLVPALFLFTQNAIEPYCFFMETIPQVQLETQRLLLRTPHMSDAQAIFEGYARQSEVARWLPFDPHQQISETLEFLEHILETEARGQRENFALIRRKDEAFMGMMNWRPCGHYGEIGYALDRTFWGQGYMPEAVRRIMKRAFEQPKIQRLQALTLVGNRASQRVLTKVGFQREGTLRNYIYFQNKDQVFDAVMWGITKNEFDKQDKEPTE